MKLRETLSRLDRLQESRRFKIGASVLVLALGAVAIASIAVLAAAPDSAASVAGAADEAARATAALEEAQRAAAGALASTGAPTGRANPVLLGSLAVGALTGVALLTVWLGLALTYLGLALLGALVAGPLLMMDSTRRLGEMAAGSLVLTAAFSAVSQGIRLALSRPTPVFAVARNVLAEAVRVKISLIFIVLLVFFLAGLPFFLDADQPLRYRVQLFLQYGTAGTFWTLALLTVFFAISTVAFEQRDKIIWQTMTKPVAAWQYLTGKWLGVVALNTSLLAVAAAGVFLFTQRLRLEPARGEVRAYVALDGSRAATDDRRILESQVLTARIATGIAPPKIDQAAFDQLVEDEVQATAIGIAGRAKEVSRIAVRERLLGEAYLQHRTIEPGASREYVFTGLGAERNSARPISVRFKINSGADNPSNLLRVTFLVAGQYAVQREAVLNTAQVFDLPDDAVPPGVPDRARVLREVRAACIGEDGSLTLQIWNGDPIRGTVNPRPISFPPDGLEVLFTAGTYEANFLRVAVILWLKLALLAAIAVAASTFLSFPVACLVTMGFLFIAETSGYLTESLKYYDPVGDTGTNYFILAVRVVAVPVSLLFDWYSRMRPASDLTDGRLVPWSTLGQALALLGLCAGGALLIGVMIFRKRELATYSGK